MRKIIALFCVLSVSVMLMAQADSTRIKGVHPYKTAENESWEHAHWSLIPYAGVNMFWGDYLSSEVKKPLGVLSYPTVGLGVECAFNPAWGLGLEYSYSMYGVAGNTDKKDPATGKSLNAAKLLAGQVHMADLYLNADLINLILPYSKKKPVALMLMVGVGGAMNNNSVFYPATQDNTAGRTSRGTTGLLNDSSMTGYDFHTFMKFGATLEFNINRTLALGIRASYNLFMDDLVEGRKFDPNCDGIMDVTLNMRFKLNAVSKTHARNVHGRDWPDLRGITTGEAREYIKEEVAKLDPTVTNIYTMEDKEPQAAQTAYAMAAPSHDTVIIYRDTVIVREVPAAAAPAAYAQTSYIYFAPDKAKISANGLITIQQVADMLHENPDLYALIIGYADNTGTRAVNDDICKKRTGNVADELVQEHEIDPARLCQQSKGKVVGKRSQAAYGPNRRVEIKLVDKQTFDSMKQQPQANNGVGQTRIVTIDQPTTLAQLARQYYGNTHAWIYIYEANTDQLNGPNELPMGIALAIPAIDEQQQQITKEACQARYNAIRK